MGMLLHRSPCELHFFSHLQRRSAGAQERDCRIRTNQREAEEFQTSLLEASPIFIFFRGAYKGGRRRSFFSAKPRESGRSVWDGENGKIKEGGGKGKTQPSQLNSDGIIGHQPFTQAENGNVVARAELRQEADGTTSAETGSQGKITKGANCS